MIETLLTLAQSTLPTSRPAPSAGNFFLETLLPMGLVMGVFYWILFRGQKKERDRQAQMLAAIKRNDRVQTVGGIFGTVVDVRDNEVVLKVDETNNVKMRFNRTAIKEVLSDAVSATAAAGKKD